MSFVPLLLVLAGVADGAAQVPPLRPFDSPICRDPAPSTDCVAFWISEVTFTARFTDSVTQTEKRYAYLTLEGGAMLNRGDNAFGGGFYYGVHVDGRRWGIKPRVRHWFGEHAALDVMPGVVLGGPDQRARMTYPGWIMQVGLEIDGVLGVTSGVEVVRRQEGGTFVDLHAGGRLGGRSGALMVLALGFTIWIVDSILGNVFGSGRGPSS